MTTGVMHESSTIGFQGYFQDVTRLVTGSCQRNDVGHAFPNYTFAGHIIHILLFLGWNAEMLPCKRSE
jgi:hypothetical protein